MLWPEEIFAPELYSKVSLPIEEAESLPVWCFTSQEFYDREVERIFMKVWNFVGRADELPNPGDYLTIEIAGEPVIVIRDREGTLRAHANTCLHRGARLLSGRGNCKAVICPYHAWSYGLNGALIAARGMEKTAHFDKSEHRLISLKLETWEGFIFVNFDPNSESLVDYLGDLTEQFAPYNFAEMICTRRVEYDLDCNWKIYAENSTECYHTASVHGATLGHQKAEGIASRGNWAAIHMPLETTVAVLPDEATTFPHISTLTGRLATGTHFALVYPSTTFCCTQDCMWWLAVYPEGPTRSKLRVGSCFPKTTVERDDFEEMAQRYYDRWDAGTPEDNEVTAIQQQGLKSRLRRAGRMSREEPVVHQLAMWVKERVVDSRL